MKKVIIFGGTTEGRKLAEILEKEQVTVVYCVATEYGKQQLEPSAFIRVRTGRMDWQEMSSFFGEEKPDAIVDATHPFAQIVKSEIENAIFDYGDVSFFRVTRAEEDVDLSNCRFFESAEECANALVNTTGRIFLTTGSKELKVFCENEPLRDRLVVRVIPSEESLKLCKENGLKGNQIIAMQGPFSAGMNLAFLRECDARYLVMKEGGSSSGEAERIIAANKANVKCYIIKRPNAKSEGLSLFQVRDKLFELFNIAKSTYSDETIDKKIQVTLAGYGMGFGSVTAEVEQAIVEADYIFGAPRLLFGIETGSKKYPYYLAGDIIPKLDELSENIKYGIRKAVVLFSGDVGFYSGAAKLKEALEKAGRYYVKLLPGISSISALSAKCKTSWQDASLMSVHGMSEEVWRPKLIELAQYNEKIFVLTSSDRDVRVIGAILLKLEQDGVGLFTIFAGTNMYADEKLLKLSAEACSSFDGDGLTTLLIQNSKTAKRRLTPGIKDEQFIRDKVPMSKEEIRAISICKLGITENAICFDIGSGSGSVAVEMGLLDSGITVYAVELKEVASELIKKNIKKFRLSNVHLISGTAPEALSDLPAPTHVFIGGSGGRLDEIIQSLKAYGNSIRVVINAVTIETVSEILQVIKKHELVDIDVVQVSVSKAKQAGEYNILQGQNPVFIMSFVLN